MKTDQVAGNKTLSYGARENTRNEPKNVKRELVDETKSSNPVKNKKERIKLEEAVINNPEQVNKMIKDNIQWREMKFYQRHEGEQVYIDVVDKETGELLRTIPDTKFADFAKNLKNATSKSIHISG